MRNPRIFVLALALVLVSCGRSARYYFDRAGKFASAGQYADAALNYRKAIQKDPRFGEAHYQLGLTELKLEHPVESFSELSQASGLLPARSDIQAALADVVLKAYLASRTRPKGLYDQLISLSDKLLAADPKSFDGLRIKGYLAAIDGKTAEALGFLGAADAVRPLQPELTLARVEIMFRNNQAAEAEKLALDLIQKNKSYGPMYDLLYRQYLVANRPVEAQNLIENKVRNNPNEAAFALELASLYARAGRREEMKAILQRMLDNPAIFPKAHLHVGDFYAGLQEWDLALREFDEGAKTDPKNKLEYMKRTVNLWLSQGKGEQAAGLVDQILKADPNDEQARAVNASLLMKSGDPKKLDAAVAEFQNLVDKNPTSAVLRFNLGSALLAKGNTEAARAQFLETRKRHKDFAPALLALAELSRARKDYSETLRFTDELLKLNPRLVPARLLRSSALMGTGDFNQARDVLMGLQRDFPQFGEAQLQLAYLDLAQRKFPAAEARIRKVLEQQPGDRSAQMALARTLVVSNQPRKAFGYLRDELKKTPDAEALQVLLAGVAVGLAEYDVAIEQYRSILARKPRPDLYVLLSSVYKLKSDEPNAIACLESAEKLAPDDAAIVVQLAQSLSAAGRKKEAIERYQHALKLNPENAAVMNNLAYLIVETGGPPDQALKLAEQSVQKAPNQPNFLDTLGWIYLKKDMSGPAIQVFRNLAKNHPESPTFHYHLGMALRKTGDETAARKEFQVALSKKPSTGLGQSIKEALASEGR